MKTFYDLAPGGGCHYLLANGQPIARFNSLATAEAVRAMYVEELAEMYERRADEVQTAGLGESPPERRDAIRLGPRIAPEEVKTAALTCFVRSLALKGAVTSQEGRLYADL